MDKSSAFGVHEFSSSQDFRSNEAFELSQQTSGQILHYIVSMGISPAFLTMMSASAPEQINLLSQQDMHDLNVITPTYTTVWDLRALPEGVYFRGTVNDVRGTHKFMFICPAPNSSAPLLNTLIEADGDVQHVVDDTSFIDLVFDDKEVPLVQNEIIQLPEVIKGDVDVGIMLTPRLMKQLQTANTFGIELIPPSRQTFVGFTADLSTGKSQLLNFLDSCEH